MAFLANILITECLVYDAYCNFQAIAKTHMKRISLVIIFSIIVVTAFVGCASIPNDVKVASDKQTELLNKLLEATSALQNSLIAELKDDRRRFREINADIEAGKKIKELITPEIIKRINDAKTDEDLREEFLKLKRGMDKLRGSILHPEMAESVHEKSDKGEEAHKDIPTLLELTEQQYKTAIDDTEVKFEQLKKCLELMREAHREVNRFLNIEIKLKKEDVDNITTIIGKIGEIEKEIKKEKKKRREQK